MPLKPDQKAALAIRIVSARFCDQNADVEADLAFADAGGDRIDASLLKKDMDLLEAAGGSLDFWRRKTKSAVNQDADVANHLHNAARAVREEIATASGISEGAWKRFQAAAALLEFFASGVQAGDGDGPALPKPVCSCGVLTDAYLIETTVQNIYKKANALTRDPPKISYQTMVIEDAKQALAPFRLAGHADISSNPRSVIITIEEVNLRALDLCQLAYVLFHELICHGFQAVGNSVRENALDTCHWSEGWMDATAFEIALKWVTEGGTSHPRPPLTGQKGRDAIWEQHRARYADKSYVAGSKVSKNIAQWRNAAREALARLRKAFVENEMAKNAQDAAELVENFVLMANAHPGANPAILRRVSEHLIALLLSKEWPSETAAAASPCRNFLDHRDLAVLEKALQGAVEERRTRRISPNALMRQMHAR